MATTETKTLSKSRYRFLRNLQEKNPGLLTPEDKEFLSAYETQRNKLTESEKRYWENVFAEKPAKQAPEITKEILMKVGRQVANNPYGFVVDKENRHAVNFVYAWITGVPLPAATLNNPGLHKGLLLAGNVGSGKTTLLEILRKFRPAYKKRAAEVVAMLENAKQMPQSLRASAFFLDELGTEPKSYGKDLIPYFLELRYELFREKGYITHITTNMSMQEIAHRYGPRIESRLYEMCNIILLGAKPNSRDFRKLL